MRTLWRYLPVIKNVSLNHRRAVWLVLGGACLLFWFCLLMLLTQWLLR